MAFTMSYGVTPQTEAVPKARAAKKGTPRVRKQSTPRVQADALFEPAPETVEASAESSEAGVDDAVAGGIVPLGT